MSSVPKGRRSISKQEFDSIYYRIHDEAADMVHQKFHASEEVLAQNHAYVYAVSKALMNHVFDLIYHIKTANTLYPTTHEELMERRMQQDKAIGTCMSMLTLYELVLHKLKVPDDKCVQEINTIMYEINAIKAWRTSDNKRFKDLEQG